MFPKLYNANETNFIHNGLGLLTGTISAIATEELNGMFELNMEYDSEGFLANQIKEEMIIKAKANDKQEEQLFRIYSITKNHDNDNLIIDAQHITNDLGNNFVEKLEAINLTKRQVMQLIGASTNFDHPFNITSSNTTTQSSTRLYRTNPLQMIAGMEGSVLQIWGGQIERDNFNLIMHDRRGSDDGVLVTYKKNLTGLTVKFDISNLVTRIFPFVFKEATDDEPEQLITVPGKYIDSPHINDYKMPYILPVDFANEFESDDEITPQRLNNVAKNWFVETGRDKPTVEMEVQFEHLWETEEYKDIAALELVGMGDTITVRHSKLNVKGTAIVNRIEYDVIARKNRAVDVGNVKASFTNKVNEVGRIIDRVEEIDKNANQAIRSANGKNTIYYGPDEPTGNINVDDIWFRVVDGEYTRTYRYDGIQWQLVISKDVKDIEETASLARNRASEAVVKAELATSNASEAIAEAQKAFDDAQDALSTAGNAERIATTAHDLANSASSLASTASSNAQTAMANARSALDGIDGLQTHVDTEISNINGELSRKVSQSVFDGLAGTVNSHSTSISQNAEAITKKADKTYVDTINNTVESHSLLIEETAEGLKAKANQSTVNTLTGEVQAHEAQLQLHAQELSSKMNSIDADAKYATQSALQQTSQSLSSDIVVVQGKIDGLEIGTTNLAENSKQRTLAPRDTGSSSDNFLYSRYYSTDGLIPGEIYTFRARIEITHGNFNKISLYSYPGGSNQAFPIDKNGYVTRSFTANESTDSILVYAGEAGSTRGQGIIIHEAMLVRGNKIGSWQAAPEDIQYQFSSINQTVADITARVGDSEGNISALQQTTKSFATRIESAEGNISTLTQTAKGLQNRVADAEGSITSVAQLATAMQTRLTNAEGNINTLTQTASSLDSTIKSVRDDLNGLEIGGRNLLLDSKRPRTGTSYNISTFDASRDFEPGETLTVTIKGSIKGSKSFGIWFNGSSYGTGAIPEVSSGIYSKQVKVPASTTNRKVGIYLIGNQTAGDEWSFEWIKLESGNKATDWTPAPEDMATQSQITQLSNNINARVQKGDVINQINISTEDILISGKKVHITGQTTIDDASIHGAKIVNASIGNAQIGYIDAAKINSGELNTNNITIFGGNALDYTFIDGSYLESRGRFRRTWRGTTKTHDIKLRFQNGYLRARNDNEDRSLYFTDFGMSTFADGSGDGTGSRSSGTIEFFSRRFNDNYNGLTLYSSAVLGIDADKFKVDSEQDIELESQAALRIRPLITRPGNNTFRFTLSNDNVATNVDGYLLYGSESDPHASGFRFSKRKSDPLIQVVNSSYATGGDTGIEAGYGWFNTVRRRSGNLYVNLQHADIMRVGADSNGRDRVEMGAAYRWTVSSAANMHLTSEGTVTRSTSARKYKRAIEPIDVDVAMRFYNQAQPVYYRPFNTHDENMHYSHYGYIADDVALIEPRLVQFGQDGAPEGFNYDRVPTLLHVAVKSEIERLDEKIELTREDLVLKIAGLEQELMETKQKIKKLEDAA